MGVYGWKFRSRIPRLWKMCDLSLEASDCVGNSEWPLGLEKIFSFAKYCLSIYASFYYEPAWIFTP